MAIKAINLVKTVEYELSFDDAIGTDESTKFTLGALDARVFSVIKDKATALPVSAFSNPEGAMASLNMNQTNFEIVVFGLRGWKNFQDESGNQVNFKTVHTILGGKTYITADPDLIAQLPDEAIAELANKIMDLNSPTEEDRKNSEE